MYTGAMISVRRIGSALLLGGLFVLQACDGGPTGPKVGSLTVNVNSLPAGLSGAVTVYPPEAGTPVSVTSTTTIPDLDPGIYQVKATRTSNDRSRFTPVVDSQAVEVSAGTTPAVVNVEYRVATGIVNLSISGVPDGTANVTLFDGRGFFANVSSSGEIPLLEPGDYSTFIGDVTADEVYRGTAEAEKVTVVASTTPVSHKVTYAAITGSILISSNGLPSGAVPTWDVEGPSNYSQTLSGTGVQTLARLMPGRYTIRARNFDVGADTYGVVTGPFFVDVVAGAKTPAVLSYVTRPPTLNIVVDGAYITQSTQRYAGDVPLVANRDGYLRVFLRANELNGALPKVRATFYRNGAVVSTLDMTAPSSGVALSVSERTNADSWSVLVPQSVIQPGTSFFIDADPDNEVREVNESDNRFPSSGGPRAMDVRAVPPLELTFVPITTSVNSLTGDVSASRVPFLLSGTLKMFPINAWDAVIREPLVTSTPALVGGSTASDGDGWSRILGEVNAVRVAEGSSRYYVGILKTTYSSGIVGIGYLPGRSTVSWDASPAPNTIAHELGHNWGRRHAPCGNPAGPDPAYPYEGARIGVYGYDVEGRSVQDASLRDLMSYCRPEWVSDYTYEGILAYRAAQASSQSVTGGSVQSALTVWGSIDGNRLELQPAFMTETRPALPKSNGRYRVEGFDRAGASVFSLSFDPDPVAELEGRDLRQFAFAVPMSEARAASIVSIRLTGGGGEVRVTASPAGSANVVAEATSGGVRLAWNAETHPLLVVRDPRTGQILSLARGGSIVLPGRRTSLDIVASDMVRSTRLTIPVRE